MSSKTTVLNIIRVGNTREPRLDNSEVRVYRGQLPAYIGEGLSRVVFMVLWPA